MTKPHEKSMNRKARKTPSGTTIVYTRKKPSKQKCPITKENLKGVANAGKGKISKLSKTKRRPSVPFGGVLSSKAREKVFLEAGKIAAGIKKIDDVDEKYKKYVKQARRRAD